MITNKLVVFGLLLNLVACSNLDEFILKEGQDPSLSGNGTMISITEANKIVKAYLKKQHIPWGSPTKVRTAPNRIIFNFQTPKHELRDRGPRRLVVNVQTGEVGLPITSGGDFNEIQAPPDGQRYIGESRN